MQLILTTSLGGIDFSLQPGTMIDIDDAGGERLLKAGYARELLKSEPTELQSLTCHVMAPSNPPETENTNTNANSNQGESNTVENVAIADMTVDQLRDIAKQLGLDVKSRATKAELLAAIEAEGEGDE